MSGSRRCPCCGLHYIGRAVAACWFCRNGYDPLEGVMTAQLGDWIVRGVQGEFYPVKPDIFEETYEPVE